MSSIEDVVKSEDQRCEEEKYCAEAVGNESITSMDSSLPSDILELRRGLFGNSLLYLQDTSVLSGDGNVNMVPNENGINHQAKDALDCPDSCGIEERIDKNNVDCSAIMIGDCVMQCTDRKQDCPMTDNDEFVREMISSNVSKNHDDTCMINDREELTEKEEVKECSSAGVGRDKLGGTVHNTDEINLKLEQSKEKFAFYIGKSKPEINDINQESASGEQAKSHRTETGQDMTEDECNSDGFTIPENRDCETRYRTADNSCKEDLDVTDNSFADVQCTLLPAKVQRSQKKSQLKSDADLHEDTGKGLRRSERCSRSKTMALSVEIPSVGKKIEKKCSPIDSISDRRKSLRSARSPIASLRQKECVRDVRGSPPSKRSKIADNNCAGSRRTSTRAVVKKMTNEDHANVTKKRLTNGGEENLPTSKRIKESSVGNSKSSTKGSSEVVVSAIRPKKCSSSTGKGKKATNSFCDPYSFENNRNNHPEPLQHVQMELKSFGTCKFTKAPSHNLGKYTRTEQTACERRSNLFSMASAEPKSSRLSSLTELTTGGSSNRINLLKASPLRQSNNGAIASSFTKEVFVSSKPKNSQRSSPKSRQDTQSKRKSDHCSPALKRITLSQETSMPGVDFVALQLNDSQQLEIDHRPSGHVSYDLGARVYALWDKMYYAAQISAERDSNGRYEVVFVEDKKIRRLVSTGIIPLRNLVFGKKCLMTVNETEEECLEPVNIVESPPHDDSKLWREAVFKVETTADPESGTTHSYKIPWHKLVLGPNEAREIQTSFVNTTREINADNIGPLEGRRSRASRYRSTNDLSKIRQDSALSSSEISLSKLDDLENSIFEKSSSHCSVNVKKSGNFEVHDSIFDGIAFVVTSAIRSKPDANHNFNKREIRELIDVRGGTLLDDFSETPSDKEVFLIADTFYRTYKYLSALARAVPCISNNWITDCVEKNVLLDYSSYMLPAGLSLLTNEISPWHSRNSTLFQSKKFFIHSESALDGPGMLSSVEIWSPLLSHMGAVIVKNIFSEPLDVLITDPTCPLEILAAARKAKVNIVSSEWIIQSIIHGYLPPFDAHERFSYDFTERTN